MNHKLLARRPVGNPRRVWRQDNFLLTVASAGPMSSAWEYEGEFTLRKTRRAVKTCIEAGFNMIGCLWAYSEMAMDIVRTAESLGGNVLFQDLHRFGGMGHKNIFCETNDYKGVIEDTRLWSCIKGYCMWDEPVLREHMEETRRMIDYCERVRPGILPYTVANPDYNKMFDGDITRYASYIDAYLDTIDPAQMSFDYYPIGRTMYDPALQLDNSTMWSDLELVRRAAQKRGIPLWFAYQGQRYPWHKIYYTFRFEMARAMAYAGVLYGAKGLECYTEFDGFVDPSTGGEGLFFEEQKKLNTELRNLGHTLMALKCLRVIHDDTLLAGDPSMEGLRTPIEESELIEDGLVPRTSISEHTDDYGNRYLMVLNRDYDRPATLSLKLRNPSHVYEVGKKDGEESLAFDYARKLPISLEAGELRLYRIASVEGEPSTVEYYLEKK